MARFSNSSWHTLRLALSLVWSAGRAPLIAVIAATVISSIAIAGQLLVGRELLNLITGDAAVSSVDLIPYLLVLGAMLFVNSLSQTFAAELRMPLGERLARSVTEQVLDVATEVDVESYESNEFHDRLGRAQSGAGSHSSAVVFGLVTLITTFFVTIGITLVLFTVSPFLVPIVAIGYFPIALVNMRNNRAFYRMEVGLVEIQRERAYIDHLLTQRNEAKEIRSYGIATTLRAWHGAFWDERMRRVNDLVRRRLALTTIASSLSTAILIATLALVLVLAVRDSITIGEAAVAIVGLQQLSGRLRGAGSAFANTHQGVTFLRDFEDFRAMLPELRERRPSGHPPEDPKHLRVDDVTYRYPASAVDALQNVSFELRKGQILAIVGANGSGKSTLMKILCGLLPPTTGSVTWDGVDIGNCDPDLVRKRIAPVFQDYARFLFRLRDAIGLGDVDRIDDLEGIRSAARDAGIDYLFETLPAGTDARLGKIFTGGTDLSIGQWQRVAIARAFFRAAPVVILDEPSASLDPRGEAELFDLLHEFCADRIVVFVSHRFATVRSADLVMVMDQGQVVELGSHDELMTAGGLYSELFELQADRYGLDREPIQDRRTTT
jgi:ATP-binding cassette, subfamily B, bacterial